MKVAFVFPGQGAQYVGMGSELKDAFPIVKKTFEEADDALGFSISRLFLEGNSDELRLTYYAQPAILTTSVAFLRAFWSESGLRPDFVAGHSLGEYSALVAADVLRFEDAVKLVHTRGHLMNDAFPAGLGGMAAILGADEDKLKALCHDITDATGQLVDIANYNCKGQLVVSGAAEAVAQVVERAGESGARRALPLDVSGPFHSPLMKEAGARLTDYLMATSFAIPSCPVVANVTGRPIEAIEDIKNALALQVASPVLWEASVLSMQKLGADLFIEFGPGTVLSGLIKKVSRDLQTQHVEDRGSLDQAIAAVSLREVCE